MSDVPIRLSRKLRSVLLRANKAKTPAQKLQLASTIRPNFFIPEVFSFEIIVFVKYFLNFFLCYLRNNFILYNF